MHVIAAKAVAFGVLCAEFKASGQVITNAQALADELMKGGTVVTGGTDNHVMLVDLRPKGVKGNATEKALGAPPSPATSGIPFDPENRSSLASASAPRRHHPRLWRG